MPLPIRETGKALERAGFQHATRAKHDFYTFMHNGRATQFTTALSRSYSELSDSMVGQVARQIGLQGRKQKLVEYVNGLISVDDFRSLLIRQLEPQVETKPMPEPPGPPPEQGEPVASETPPPH